MLKKTAQIFLVFAIMVNGAYAMEKEDQTWSYVKRLKKKIFNKDEKKNNVLKVETTNEEDNIFLPNSYGMLRDQLYHHHFLARECAEQFLKAQQIPADIRKVIATFLYDIASSEVVYQFPSGRMIQEILCTIPEEGKKYLPKQSANVAYDYTNEYIVNGTRIVHDGFCSFPFFAETCYQAKAPFYYAFYFPDINQFETIEKSDVHKAPLRKYSSLPAHGFYINGFLDLLGRPINLSQCHIRLKHNENAECIMVSCDKPASFPSCKNPYHFRADQILFKIFPKNS